MASMTDIGKLLTSSPEYRKGRPCIAGTGLTVHRIVNYHRMGMPPSEIADEYGHINLAQVYAALAYYYANQDEIDAEIAADDAEETRVENQFRALS